MQGEKYIDIHTHILPGVDDGARNIEESISMLKQAEAEGIGTVLLTPHQKPERRCVNPEGILTGIGSLQERLEQEHLEMTLYPGGELLYNHGLRKQLAEKHVCTLAGSRYILVEFLPDEEWRYIHNGLYELVCDGYRPVVAHVERYIQLLSAPDRVRELIDMDCCIQVNAGSIMGTAGFGIKRAARHLLKEQLVHFVATDAHRESGKRGVQLKGCAIYLKKKYGQEYADLLLWKNAEKILTDSEV